MDKQLIKKFLKRIVNLSTLTESLLAASTGKTTKEQEKSFKKHISTELIAEKGEESEGLVKDNLHEKEPLLKKTQDSLVYLKQLFEHLMQDYTGGTSRKIEDELIELEDDYREIGEAGLDLKSEISEIQEMRQSIIKKRDEMKKIHENIEEDVEKEKKKREKKEIEKLNAAVKKHLISTKKIVSKLPSGGAKETEKAKEALENLTKDLNRLEHLGMKVKSYTERLEKIKKDFNKSVK